MTAQTIALPTTRDTVREAYEDWMYEAWTKADTATHGYMVHELAASKGIRGADLYLPGAGRAPMSAASSELVHAWDMGDVPRPVSFASWARMARTEERTASREDMPGTWIECRKCGTSNELWTRGEVAAYLRVQPGTVTKYVDRGRFVPPMRLSTGEPLWPAAAVEAWAQARGERRAAGGVRGPAARVGGAF